MRRRGFTIVEILLVLALLAIIAGMVAVGAVGMIDAAKMEPPDRVLKRAVLDAVYHASERKAPAFLRYDGKRATFLVTDAAGAVLAFALLEGRCRQERLCTHLKAGARKVYVPPAEPLRGFLVPRGSCRCANSGWVGPTYGPQPIRFPGFGEVDG